MTDTPPTILNDPVLTIKQVAPLLNLNEWTVREWVDEGRLPAVRLGTGPRAPIRVRVSDVEKLLVPIVPRGPRPPRARREVCSAQPDSGGADDSLQRAET